MRNFATPMVRSYYRILFGLAVVWGGLFWTAEPVSADPARPETDFAANHFSGCGGVYVLAVNEAYEQRVVELVNQERAAVGLPPLKRIKSLDDAARYHAVDMAQDDYFQHDTYDMQDGTLFLICDVWTRIKSYYASPRAENIAAGHRTPEEVMAAWMASQSHKANILGASWEIGVGYFEGSGGYQRYWVQDFGKRSGEYPLIINAEAARTSQPEIEIYIYGDWDEMRLSLNGGEWTAWQPFQNTFTWVLENNPGVHTVAAELRAEGRTNVFSEDQIQLVTPPPALPSQELIIYLPVVRN